jgi:hypothetical protein
MTTPADKAVAQSVPSGGAQRAGSMDQVVVPASGASVSAFRWYKSNDVIHDREIQRSSAKIAYPFPQIAERGISVGAVETTGLVDQDDVVKAATQHDVHLCGYWRARWPSNGFLVA